ncbi:uncharacterized protein KGF55_000241 [Candida pseudojiufengensis]|uniref:uncharacterized protein n=1 Tax=Candida pseudojiufengensis TaxID=497109 RepID=UPI002224105B|nr:uncharacterized protein KGF55_000241 [Candida pseudojiufengensis]KAI5966832.1 hypothetical protein KGF55_000241 [Candida pseudojiufengensis]
MSSEKPSFSHLEDDKKAQSTHIEIGSDLKGSDSELGPSFIEENEDYYVDLPESLQDLTQEELKRLDKKTLRKIDLRLMTMLITIYILNYIDRNNIASARLGGLEKDLGLKGNQYQICISILFVGYILFQIPSNMLLNKLGRPSAYLAVVMTLWGAISACTAAVTSFGGLVAIRATLGIVESAFFCAALMILSSWYDKKTLASRNAILYAGSFISSAFSGLLAAGILQMDGLGGIEGWRYLFIIEGCLTVLIAPLAYWILPDTPSNTKFLNQQEKDIIQWKLRRDLGNVDDSDKEAQVTDWEGFLLAVKDIKMWCLAGMLSFLVAACGVTNFFPTIVGTLGFTHTITLVLTAPPYLVACIVCYLFARHADKTGERSLHIICPMILAMIAFIIAVSTLNTGARYFSMILMIPSLYCSFIVILTAISNSCPRPPAKRAVAIALVNSLSNTTSIWNSFLYGSQDGPRFVKAMICNIVFLCLAIFITIIWRFRLMVLNNRISKGTMNWEKELGKGNDGSKISPNFRYLY